MQRAGLPIHFTNQIIFLSRAKWDRNRRIFKGIKVQPRQVIDDEGNLYKAIVPTTSIIPKPEPTENDDFEEVTIEGESESRYDLPSFSLPTQHRPSDTDPVFMCKPCKIYFPLHHMLDRHMKTMHHDKKPTSILDKLREKAGGFHRENNLRFVCDHCPFSSILQVDIISHVGRKHGLLRKPLATKTANYTIGSKIENKNKIITPIKVSPIKPTRLLRNAKSVKNLNKAIIARTASMTIALESKLSEAKVTSLKRKRVQLRNLTANKKPLFTVNLDSDEPKDEASEPKDEVPEPKDEPEMIIFDEIVEHEEEIEEPKEETDSIDLGANSIEVETDSIQVEQDGIEVETNSIEVETDSIEVECKENSENSNLQYNDIADKEETVYEETQIEEPPEDFVEGHDTMTMSIPETTFEDEALEESKENRDEPGKDSEGNNSEVDNAEAKKKFVDPRTLICQFCEYTSTSRAAMRVHINMKHKEEWEKEVIRRDQERRLWLEEQGRTDLEHVCHFCNFAATSRSTLTTHTRRKHPGMMQPYINQKPRKRTLIPDSQCGECGYRSKDRHKVEVHMLRKHSEFPQFECSYCQKKFKVKCDLKAHIRYQHFPNPVVCEKCGKLCHNANALHVHLRREHYRAEFKCSFCSRCMVTSQNLQDHIRRQHTEKVKQMCEQCGKCFDQPNKLKQHKMTHTGEKPHKCHICSRSFARRAVYRQHMLIHTGKKPYICDICGKAFTQKPGLICHRKTHPGDKEPLPVVRIDGILKSMEKQLAVPQEVEETIAEEDMNDLMVTEMIEGPAIAKQYNNTISDTITEEDLLYEENVEESIAEEDV